MAENLITTNLANVIATQLIPAVTLWNRLEGRPRIDNFERALRAEVRDALWMLTRQWQIGEFRGDDAGSPIFTKVRLDTTRLRKYRAADGPVEEFNDAIPLEARVEQMPIPLVQATHDAALDVRLLAGRHWSRMIQTLAPAAVAEFVTAYPIYVPDPLQPHDAPSAAHVEAWSSFAAVTARRMDGVKLYQYLKASPTNKASDGILALAGQEDDANLLGDRFVTWFEKLFYQPTQPSAWLPQQLEYQFECSSPQRTGEKVFTAEEYYHGHLDWYNFDVDTSRDVLGTPSETPEPPKSVTLTMLPTPATFNGMPNTRWWAFEDSRTNFGDVKPDTTDLAKLLLIEFGLIFANDWFQVPFTVPAGSVVNVRGLAVTNVFGERIWIEAAGRGDDEDWQRWAMFLLSIKGEAHQPADLSLMIPPAAQQVLESRPREQIMFLRDEMANMVWGVEETITLPSDEPKRGYEAAQETRTFFEQEAERRLGAPPVPPPPAEGAKVRYRVMTSVPENWIPMIPVHIAGGDNRQTQLQRAGMLRIIEGDSAVPAKVSPRTSLLRPGLDTAVLQPYFLHEEEVPRAGVRVMEKFQRTRWRDGRAWLWLGVRKQTGRGEGSSGLAFDQVIDVPQES